MAPKLGNSGNQSFPAEFSCELATYSAQACDLIEAIAIGAPPTTKAIVHDWGRANASYWLWTSEAHEGAFVYNNDKLLAAGTMCAPEFEVSRSYPTHSTEEHIFKCS